MRELTQELSEHLSNYIEVDKNFKIMGKNYKYSFLLADKLILHFKTHLDGSFFGLYHSNEIVDRFNVINRNFNDLSKNIDLLPSFIKHKSDSEMRDYIGESFDNTNSPLEHIQAQINHYGKSFSLITNKLKKEIESFQKNRKFNKTNIALIDACMDVWLKDLKQSMKPKKIMEGNQSLFLYLYKIFQILKLDDVNIKRVYSDWIELEE